MPLTLKYVLAAVIACMLVGGPYAYIEYKDAHYRNFRVVRRDVLYRSGQLSLKGLRRVIEEHGIRTVISLRTAKQPNQLPPDHEEETYCRAHGIRYFRIRPRVWHGDETVPAEIGLIKFFSIMDDESNYPVLIHCFAGCHRTGAHCAVYRMEYEGWSNREAVEEMRHNGYTTIDGDRDVLGYLLNYRGRAHMSPLMVTSE